MVLANIPAIVLAEAPNGVLGTNNKLAGCEVTELVFPSENSVGDLSEGGRVNVCGGHLVDPLLVPELSISLSLSLVLSFLLSLSLSSSISLSASLCCLVIAIGVIVEVDPVIVSDIHAILLAGASNGMYGRNNKLDDFTATEDLASSDLRHRGYRWLGHRWRRSQ